MRAILSAIGLATLVLLSAARLWAGDRMVALVIAVEGYDSLRPLETPVRDALAVQGLLDSLVMSSNPSPFTSPAPPTEIPA